MALGTSLPKPLSSLAAARHACEFALGDAQIKLVRMQVERAFSETSKGGVDIMSVRHSSLMETDLIYDWWRGRQPIRELKFSWTLQGFQYPCMGLLGFPPLKLCKVI